MKLAPTTVALALAVAGGAALPIDDIRRMFSEETSAPRFHHDHGDYPRPGSDERFASLAQGSQLRWIAAKPFLRHVATV
jgi:hypothetical protein